MELLFYIRYLLSVKTAIFIKYKITFLLDTINYWLCYHIEALEIITHLALKII